MNSLLPSSRLRLVSDFFLQLLPPPLPRPSISVIHRSAPPSSPSSLPPSLPPSLPSSLPQDVPPLWICRRRRSCKIFLTCGREGEREGGRDE